MNTYAEKKELIREIYKNDLHKIIIKNEDDYTFHFHYVSLKTLLNMFLISDVSNIIIEYFDTFFVKCYTRDNNTGKRITITRISNEEEELIEFDFMFSKLFSRQPCLYSNKFNQLMFNTTDCLGQDMENITDKTVRDVHYLNINHLYIFEEYVKYFSNIDNQKIENYLSRFDKPICNCTDGSACVMFTSKYDIKDNNFKNYINTCAIKSSIIAS